MDISLRIIFQSFSLNLNELNLLQANCKGCYRINRWITLDDILSSFNRLFDSLATDLDWKKD